MRRLFGISCACLVTSACAIDKTPEKSTSHYPSEDAGFFQGSEAASTIKSSSLRWGATHEGWSVDYSSQRVEQRCESFEPAADACGGIPFPYCGQLRRQTASGEILDTDSATAAHRSLPLASYANVTNLDNGRSVVVKINDRGPYTRGRILDLSPRAADALGMKRAGVAAVAVEPLVNQAAPTVTVSETSGAAVTQ
jgi:rare lipoprotein A (peptidoglycan hydrolase)